MTSTSTVGGIFQIPGIAAVHQNDHVQRFKEPPWNEVFRLLGQRRIPIMRDLFLDCGIFVPLEDGQDNLYQLSGSYNYLEVLKIF